jgi:GntR family transcriptional repressor for pyruvate dehydrogenase complex
MSVTTEAIEKVEEMILSGEPQPGAKLPRENELAQRLGVSRSSLPGAVRALAALNVIEARQGDGTYPELARAADLTHLAEGESWLRRALGRDVDGEAPEGG